MAPTTSARQAKNIWIAASDGDLERVKYLIEVEGMSPNVSDQNTYTPMHAAASYAHLELIDYLISKGGDINVTDEDGETPLFTVESEATAKYLVERGAKVNVKNEEGQTPAEYLFEDHPEVAVYLQTLLVSSDPTSALSLPTTTSHPNPADLSSNESALPPNLTDTLTSQLLDQTDAIMRDAEETGEDPEARLREVVGRAVLNGWGQVEGQQHGEGAGQEGGEERGSKRTRMDED